MAYIWFKFPEGMSGISVALQEYKMECVDPVDGRHCFRAPEHFAAMIIDGTNISLMPAPPEGAPTNSLGPDQTVADPNTLLLGGQINSLKLQVEGLQASLTELRTAYETQKLQLIEAESKLSQFAEANPDLAKELRVGVTVLETMEARGRTPPISVSAIGEKKK